MKEIDGVNEKDRIGERIGVRSFFPNLKRNGQLGA